MNTLSEKQNFVDNKVKLLCGESFYTLNVVRCYKINESEGRCYRMYKTVDSINTEKKINFTDNFVKKKQ